MITIHVLAASEPALVGVPRMHCRVKIRERPALCCSAWRLYCKEAHEVEFPDPPLPLEVAILLGAPCRSGPFAGAAVILGLDPARNAEHNRLVLHHAQAVRPWRWEGRLRRWLAGARERDRRHLADGWGVVIPPAP
jgi:hypothetical protein